MNDEADQRIAMLAAELDRLIPKDDGFVTSTPYRDETIVEGDRTGLLTFALLLLLRATGSREVREIEERIDKMVPGGSVTYLGAQLITPQDIRKRRRAARSDIGCLIVGIATTLFALVLAVIGGITVVKWII